MSSPYIKWIVVAVVAVVIIAAAAVVITNDKGDNKSESVIDSALTIYGNADNNETIDSSDLDIVDDIINGDKKLVDYPLADVNCDGTVNSTDVQILQKIIDREPTQMWVSCLDASGNQTSVEISYPLKNIVPAGTNMIEPFINIGGVEYTAGYFYSGYETAEKAMTSSSAVDLKGSSRSISEAAWQNFMLLDSSLVSSGGIGALLVDQSFTAINSYRDQLVAAGIPEIRFAMADPMSEISATLTVGFIMGTQCEKIAFEYSETSWKIVKEIQEYTSKIADSDKPTYIALTMTIYICQNDSTFNTGAEGAGGMPYYKTNAQFASDYAGNGSAKMQSTEALSNYDDADRLISNRSSDFIPEDLDAEILDTWEKYIDYFKDLDDYHGLVYVNNLLPGACKLAVLANIFYEDEFSDEWVQDVLSQFYGKYVTLQGVTLENTISAITYEDYQAAKA